MRKKQAPATIVRAPKDRKNPYKMVRQATFEDARLTWEDRGVLGYLLVKPDDWEIEVADLWQAGNAGRNKIYGILAHLEECGYLRRETIRIQGRFVGTRYVLHEEPIVKTVEAEQLPFPENGDTEEPPPCTENGDTVDHSPFPENRDTVGQSPFPGLRYPVNPYPVNREHTNNEYITNNEKEKQERKETKEFVHSFVASPEPDERAVALLTDPEVGLAQDHALEIASSHSFDTIVRQVFAWRDGIAKGSQYNSTKALLTRFERDFDAAPPSAKQRASDLYHRHCAGTHDADDLPRSPYKAPIFGAAPPAAQDVFAIRAAEQERVQLARDELVQRLHTPSPETLRFWERVKTDVRLTMTAEHYQLIADAAILEMDEETVTVATWDRAMYIELLHPFRAKALERTMEILAQRKLKLVCEFWDDGGRVVAPGERPPVMQDAAKEAA